MIIHRPVRVAACLLTVLLAAAGAVRAGDEERETSPETPAVINAWAVDMPSSGTVTKIDGVIVILDREKKKYVLLEVGREIVFDDIVRMTSQAVLEIRYKDGSKGVFDFKDFPEHPAGPGTWLVFKEQAGEGGL